MREIKFRAFDDGKMLYSHNNITNSSKFQNKWFFEKIREDAIVMQYTGLKDDEGREIYEGDILSAFYPFMQDNEDPKTLKISFNSGVFWAGYHALKDAMNSKVIGNIYENPELLTK